VRGRGLLAGIELVRDRETKEPFSPELRVSVRLGELALARGIAIYPGSGAIDGVAGDHILVSPPLSTSEADIDLIADRLLLAFEDLEDWLETTVMTAESDQREST
jgi:adenosylmethionine-8-amino-7-oxononanoate aminotransferase